MGTGRWAPPGGGGNMKKVSLPLRLPLEIRNHDGSHLVKRRKKKKKIKRRKKKEEEKRRRKKEEKGRKMKKEEDFFHYLRSLGQKKIQ